MSTSPLFQRAATRCVLLALALSAGCAERAPTVGVPGAAAQGGALPALLRSAADEALAAFPRRGLAPPPGWAEPPRFEARPPEERQPGERQPGEHAWRCLPDGELGEWPAAEDPRWIAVTERAPGARHLAGEADLGARIAFLGAARGLCFAAIVRDDAHRPATHAAALAQSDAIELTLWPESSGPRARQAAPGSLMAQALGVRLRFGTQRELVEVARPDEPWRALQVRSAGVPSSDGYRVEARLPLEVLTPLLGPEVDAVRYAIAIRDADADHPAEAALQATGRAALAPAPSVPPPIQQRVSLRTCLAAEPEALIGYRDGWRCSVPYAADDVPADDTAAPAALRLGHARLLDAPRLQTLRERLVLLNVAGVRRGIVGLLDKHDRILSVLRLGLLGSRDPGNAQVKRSDAIPIKLPDESWAVAVTHAAAVPAAGARCSAAHRVHASLIALRGAVESTLERPAPRPTQPAALEEIFRVALEDCVEGDAAEWSLSADRRTIAVQDLVNPAQRPRSFAFKDGWYQPLASD